MEYSAEEYRKAYVEVLAVLEYLREVDEEDYAKIPADRIAHMEEEKDPSYQFTFDKDVLIKHQTRKLTQEFIAYIYFNYIASPAKQREVTERKRAMSGDAEPTGA